MEHKFIPKVVFKEMSLEENIEIIEWAVDENNAELDVRKYTNEYFPELAAIENNTSEENKKDLINKVVSKKYNSYYEEIKKEVIRYNEIWNFYNDKFFLAIANYLNTSWPLEHPIIIAKIGLIPVFPRYLEDFSFAITIGLKEEKVIETTAHETCHFIWFNKWAQLYPHCPKIEYDSPYLPWKYSEMVVDPILNSKEINNIFANKFIEKSYDQFYELKYDNKLVMNVLKEIFIANESIENKIKTGYNYILKVYNTKIEQEVAKVEDTKEYDITVFGGCSLDQIYYQREDGTYPKEADLYVPGGKGANQAVAASRAGVKVNIISRINNDRIGKCLVENLENNAVDTSCIEMVDDSKNDTTKILVDLNGEKEIERFYGTINTFTPDMITNYKKQLFSSKLIVTQMKMPKEVTVKLIDFCYENYIPLIITPSNPEKLSIVEAPSNELLINKITYITCNKKECQIIFGTDDIEKCVTKYPNKLIVTLGKEGVIYHDGNKIIKIPAIRTDGVIDTTGAGDTFNGNLAAMLSQSHNLKESIYRAVFASAIKIGVKSAQDGMPYKEQLDNCIEAYQNGRAIDWSNIPHNIFAFTKEEIEDQL